MSKDVSALIRNKEQFSAAFEEEANFCAGATQIHTHSPTCVKYSISRPAKAKHLCRFKAPWRLVERTAFTSEGVLQIRRNHSMVNRWNKAIAVGLRHNHDISFIATQCRTMAIVFYVTNYATKVEDPVWKRVAAAAQLLPSLDESPIGAEETSTQPETSGDGRENKTRQFLMRVANRIFTERALSQVEVMASLMGYSNEFANNDAWTFLNVSSLYWHVLRRWSHLRHACGEGASRRLDDEENVLVEQCGERISLLQAYQHRGQVLQTLCLYDYMSIVKLKRRGRGTGRSGEIELEKNWLASRWWVQTLRKPGKHAMVCLDEYLSVDFGEQEGPCHRRWVPVWSNSI